MCRSIRALVVDDDARFRVALAAVLALDERFVVIGEAASGEAAVDLARSTPCDLVVLDVRMPGIGGLAAAAALREARPDAVVVLVSTDAISARSAIDAGADCFLPKMALDADALARASEHGVSHGGGDEGER
jgi:DNA-binding NarL/FixJ family response regulator